MREDRTLILLERMAHVMADMGNERTTKRKLMLAFRVKALADAIWYRLMKEVDEETGEVFDG